MTPTKDTAQRLGRTGTKKKATRAEPEQLCNTDELYSDSRKSDQTAIAACLVIAELQNIVELRCAAYGTTKDEEWNRALHPDELEADIKGRECERRRTAIRLKVELEQWRLVRAIANGEGEPLSFKEAARWELRIRATMRRLKEWGSPTLFAN